MNNIATFFRESKTARFLFPVGIILIVFGIVMYVINSKNQNYIETEAIVSSCELYQEESFDAEGNVDPATYTVNIKYTVDEKEYEGSLDGVSKHNQGDRIKIYYNPSDPSQITQTTSLVLPIILVVAGIISFAGGIVSAKNAIKKHKALKAQEEGWENGK